LRIAVDDVPGAFRLSVARTPHDGDTVIAAAAASVFVAPHAIRLLDRLALDAHVDGTGALRFGVTSQAS
jgi:hypothetical protein